MHFLSYYLLFKMIDLLLLAIIYTILFGLMQQIQLPYCSNVFFRSQQLLIKACSQYNSDIIVCTNLKSTIRFTDKFLSITIASINYPCTGSWTTVDGLRKEIWRLRINWSYIALLSVLLTFNITSLTSSYHQFVINPSREDSESTNGTLNQVRNVFGKLL